jgi:hypothetical protein
MYARLDRKRIARGTVFHAVAEHTIVYVIVVRLTEDMMSVFIVCHIIRYV